MADSIPQAYFKELTDTLAAESLKVAFFVNITGYTQATATTYAVLAGTATEVSNVGTGYTTGGYALTVASSNYGTTGAKVTASATVVNGATFTYKFAVIYNATTGKIRCIKDHTENKTASGGTVTVTWDNVIGIMKHSYTEI